MGLVVELQRTGGFAGIGLGSSVSEDELSPTDLQLILDLVGRFEGPVTRARQQHARPDRFQYDVTVSGRGASRHATMWEHELEPAERNLLARMIQMRRPEGNR